MKVEDLKEGMYQISKTVKNPKPDRRRADRNFSAAEIWPKGKRVCVKADFDHPLSFKIFHLSGYEHLGVNGRKGGSYNHPGFELLVDVLEPVEWTDKEWVRAHINNGDWVLERLLEAKKISREDILAILNGDHE